MVRPLRAAAVRDSALSVRKQPFFCADMFPCTLRKSILSCSKAADAAAAACSSFRHPFSKALAPDHRPRSTFLSSAFRQQTHRTMSTMKAIQFSQVGGVEVLEFKDVPRPSAPLPGTILVQNKYAGVNFIDTYHRTGLYKVQLPFIPGREGSGVVEAVGDGVTEFKVGDRVAYMAGQTYAEYTVAPAWQTVKLPDNVSFEDGAALLLQGATAMSLVLRANEVKPGDFVLIHAAAGGTGRLLTQVCKNLGAFVIGTTSTAEKAATAKACGADVIINYSTSDVVEEVKRVTGGKGVHVVYDGVGRTTFETSLACLRRLGTMASFGNASGKVADVDIMKLVPRAVKLMRPSLFEFIKDKEDFDFLVQPLMKMMNEKKLNLHIHKIYDIKDSANAHVDLEGRSTQGKLILKL